MKATHSLSNLDVSYVSLVSRAAVRDPSNPSEPQRFLLTKHETPVVDLASPVEKAGKKKAKGRGKGKRTLFGSPVTEQELAAMHGRATSGQHRNDQGSDTMAKQARETIRKVDAGEPVSADELSRALASSTRKAAAQIRKSDPNISEYEAAVQALRKGDDSDVRRLQAAYVSTINPAAADIAAAIAKGERYTPPSVGASAATELRKAAAEVVRRPGQSDYSAMVEALRRNPELGRYREVA